MAGYAGRSVSLTDGQLETLKHIKYEPLTDRVEADRAISTTLNSIYLGNQHKMSSGGEEVFFTNITSDVDWYPCWGGLKDQEIVGNQNVDGLILPSARYYSDTLFDFSSSSPHASNYVDAESMYTNTIAAAAFHITFITGEVIEPTDKLIYRVRDTNISGNEVYMQSKEGFSAAVGDTISWWFDHPVSGTAGSEFYESISIQVDGIEEDERFLSIRSDATILTTPYRSLKIRTFLEWELETERTKATSLDAYMSTDLTFDVGLEEKVIGFDTIKESHDINLGAGGELEVTKDGRYAGHLILQINEISDPTIVVWNEVKPLATGVWELSGGMAKTRFKADASWTLTLDGTLELKAGDKVRVKAMMLGFGADGFTLEGISQVADLGTLVQPAAHIEVVRVGANT